MLYIVLTVSVLHLAWMNWLVYRRSDASICLLSALAPLALMCGFVVASPAISLQSIAIAVLFCFHRWLIPARPSVFFRLSLLIVVGLFAVSTWIALSSQRDLRKQFPMESMAERVRLPKPGKPLAETPETKKWTLLETFLENDLQEHENRFWSRTNALRQLHEHTTDNFINSPGFGVTRMTAGQMQPARFEYRPETDVGVVQMEYSGPLSFSTEDLEKPYWSNNLDALKELHFGGLRDFVNSKGFGYIKARDQVAGFYPHEFSRMPDAESLRVKRLELVSLLRYDQPMVYVSNELPRMKELKKAPTRSLSDFEAKGIQSIQSGEDLFVRETGQGIHMLGAIRSVEQCVKCHGGERGDLLGAFSYCLTHTSQK
jgi:hypothetical protein